MKNKKATLNDIAKELNINVSTVSRALKNHPRISRPTKEAVLKAAENLYYYPNNIASALRKGKSNIVGVIVPTSDRKFFASVIRGIEEILRDKGYNLIICQSDEKTDKEQKIIDALLQIQVDGFIASVAKETTEFSYFEKIKDLNVPLILYDRIGEDLETSSIVCDDYNGAYKAVSHLIEQGCKRVAHFAGQQHIKIYQDRLNGYLAALKEHNLPVDDQLIIESDLIDTTEEILEAGSRMTNHLFEGGIILDGIFSASDFAAMGAIKTLLKRGVNIPDDVAIVGYSNDFSSSVIKPGLTSLDQHTKQMGIMAARLFLEQINTPKEKLTPKNIVLDPELVIRESSRIKSPMSVE